MRSQGARANSKGERVESYSYRQATLSPNSSNLFIVNLMSNPQYHILLKVNLSTCEFIAEGHEKPTQKFRT